MSSNYKDPEVAVVQFFMQTKQLMIAILSQYRSTNKSS
jgi:hypothetical protein